MFWIDFSRPGIGRVVMLPAGPSLNKHFFAGAVIPSIVNDRASNCPKLKASGIFLGLDNARPHFTFGKYDKLRSKRQLHQPYSPNMAPCDLAIRTSSAFF
jgi:hypothetical protein